jgi:4,5-DOPA dioxygenase extradiol
MTVLSSLFVSHGAPTLVLDDVPARDFLRGVAETLPRPTAIIVVSAHYESVGTVKVLTSAKPRTIHDFGGFAPELYQIRYPAPGAPDLAGRVIDLLEDAGLSAEADESWGFDHGTWVPLSLIWPEADIPVLAVSVDPTAGPSHHYRLGQALVPLAKDGVLVVGSGALTHNLGEIRRLGRHLDLETQDWVARFAAWTSKAIAENRIDDLLAYRDRAPDAVRNHPTDEHLMPLYAALGAGGGQSPGRRLHDSTTFGVLAMDAYGFGAVAV